MNREVSLKRVVVAYLCIVVLAVVSAGLYNSYPP